MSQSNHFKTLGVDKEATPAEIKKAFRKLALKYHPDRNADDKTAEDKFKKINEAYTVLSDSKRKEGFPTFGSSGFYKKYNQENIFRKFDFSGDTGRDNFRSEPQKGADIEIETEVSFNDAALGTEKMIVFLCNGTHQELKINIPAGMYNGRKIRISGKGAQGEGGGQAGDLYVKITVQPFEFLPDIETTDTTEVLSQYFVLLVDDEPNILQALKRLFRREPYTFIYANSGADGLRIMAETPEIVLIISDQRMPMMNGVEFLSLSKKLAPDAIRMMLTSHSDMEATVAAINEGGVTRYIRKPWEDSELLQTVRDGVRQYHLIKENRRQQEIIKQQKEELSSWNQNLKGRVLAQTTQIRRQVEDVHRLNQRLQSNFQGVIESMVALAELRDPKTRRHSANTASLSIAMAQALNLPSNEIEIIRIAALLHDIGKNAMSDVALAMDENNYTDEDYLEYRKHPVLGQIALDSIEDLRPAALLIRHHHERYDGMGFPDGLSGDAIPMGASIIALADCCDREMAFHFARNAVESAIDNLLKRSGTVFPPSLLPYLAKPAHDLFDHLYERHDGLTEMKVVPEKLKPGMILTSELFSRSGLLLLQAWTELDSAKIKSLQRIFTIDPLPGGIPVAIRHSRKSSSI